MNRVELEMEATLAASRLRMARIEVDFLKKVGLDDTQEMLGARQEVIRSHADCVNMRFYVQEEIKVSDAQGRLELANLSKSLQN
jgi:hypothetical protein